MEWEVIITPLAEKQLAAISDKRMQHGIESSIETLEVDPISRGKALVNELAGFRAIRAVGQRYRIIYRIDASQRRVIVAALGIRKDGDRSDIYALAKKLVKAGLLGLLGLLVLLRITSYKFSSS